MFEETNRQPPWHMSGARRKACEKQCRMMQKNPFSTDLTQIGGCPCERPSECRFITGCDTDFFDDVSLIINQIWTE